MRNRERSALEVEQETIENYRHGLKLAMKQAELIDEKIIGSEIKNHVISVIREAQEALDLPEGSRNLRLISDIIFHSETVISDIINRQQPEIKKIQERVKSYWFMDDSTLKSVEEMKTSNNVH